MNRRVSVAIAIISSLLAHESRVRADDDSLSGELVKCVEASAATAGIDPWMVPRAFARDCTAPCAGLKDYAATPPGGETWRPLATGCQLFCSDKARVSFETTTQSRRWPELAKACGPEWYGLPAAQTTLLSEPWFVVHKIGDWLAHANTIAGPRSRLALADLAKTLPRVRWLLPLPASLAGRYDELPLAGHAFDDISARDYLIVGADAVWMGARPEAKLTVQGAMLQTDWPGQLVPLATLATRQEAFRRPVQPVAGPNRGVLGQPPSPADATINMVKASSPVLLTNASTPAARVVEVLEALGENGARLGVTDGKGGVGEHLLLLTARPISIGAPTNHLSLAHHAAKPFNGTEKGDVAVWINVQDATVRELADAMNQLYDDGVRLAVVDHAAAANAPGVATPHGSLDKEVIRSVIRLHLAEVRRCYETGLAHRDMYGRVMVQFVISAGGPVVAATVQDSTLKDAAVEGCITTAVKTWTFPKPNGNGIVVVSYPFVLKLGKPE